VSCDAEFKSTELFRLIFVFLGFLVPCPSLFLPAFVYSLPLSHSHLFPWRFCAPFPPLCPFYEFILFWPTPPQRSAVSSCRFDCFPLPLFGSPPHHKERHRSPFDFFPAIWFKISSLNRSSYFFAPDCLPPVSVSSFAPPVRKTVLFADIQCTTPFYLYTPRHPTTPLQFLIGPRPNAGPLPALSRSCIVQETEL